MVAVRIIHICDQHFSQLLPVKDIDTHGSQIALRMLRLFLEFHDTVCFIRVHNTEAACFLHRYRQYGDRCIGIACLVVGKHLGIIHLVNMISRQNQNILRIVAVDEIDIL